MTEQPTEVSTPKRRERRDAAAHRQKILLAARELFAKQGVDAVSMNEIARVAKVGPGTLYRRFAHKGELCGALLKDDFQIFCAQIDIALAAVETTDSALEQLGWLINELLCLNEGHAPLITAIQDAAIGPRRLAFFQTPMYCWLHNHISTLLHMAISKGELAAINVPFMADTIQAAIAPPHFFFQREQRGLTREQISTAMRSLFIDGLRIQPEANEMAHSGR